MIVPCIDLQKGRAVQLVRGRRLRLAVADVLGQMHAFHRAGYRRLHVIDLDAAMRTGQNTGLVRRLCAEGARLGLHVWVGGGIRSAARAARLVEWGAARVIIGSAALRRGRPNLRLLGSMRRRVGRGRMVIALDTLRGAIVVRGWRERLRLHPADVMPVLAPYCSGFLCTYVDAEGTLRGTDLAWFRALRRATSLPVTAAGGICSRREVRALARLRMDAAVGMALYTGRLR